MWNAICLVQVWTRVTVSIFYDNNHYTTGTFFYYYLLIEYYIPINKFLICYTYLKDTFGNH